MGGQAGGSAVSGIPPPMQAQGIGKIDLEKSPRAAADDKSDQSAGYDEHQQYGRNRSSRHRRDCYRGNDADSDSRDRSAHRDRERYERDRGYQASKTYGRAGSGSYRSR